MYLSFETKCTIQKHRQRHLILIKCLHYSKKQINHMTDSLLITQHFVSYLLQNAFFQLQLQS